MKEYFQYYTFNMKISINIFFGPILMELHFLFMNENCCAILTLFVYVDYYQNNQFYYVKITTELYMIKYTFGEIFSSGGATLYKNPSDQTVVSRSKSHLVILLNIVYNYHHIRCYRTGVSSFPIN